MASFARYLRFVAGVAVFFLMIASSVPAAAQQPSRVDPTASAVHEQQLLKELDRIQGRVSIPDRRSGVLEQPAGRDWRYFHSVTLRWIGGIAILGMLAVLVIFYLMRGMVRIEGGRSGRTIVRFSGFERFVHWMTATCFIILAISGLNITFGRPLLLPVIGHEAFSAWSQWAKYAHNYLSFPFTIGVILIFLMWIGGNIPNKVDAEWLKEGGGIVGHSHPPAYRFNAGQKAIYWIVVLGGRRGCRDRLSVDVPILCHGHRRHAARADRSRGRECAVCRRHVGTYLYWHHRNGGCIRSHGRGNSRPELGEGAPQPMARRGECAKRR